VTSGSGSLDQSGSKSRMVGLRMVHCGGRMMAERSPTVMPFLRTIFKDVFGSETAADLDKLDMSAQELFDGILTGLKRVETAESSNWEAWDPDYVASSARFEKGRRMQFESVGQTLLPIPGLPQRDVAAPDPEGDAKRIKMLQYGVTEAQMAAAVEKQIKEDMEAAAEAAKQLAEENAAIAETEAGQKQFRNAAADDLQVATLRSRGKNKEADKLQAKIDEERRVKELMEMGGLSEAGAKAMAADERGIAEDQAYFDRTGRRKGKGANYKPGFTGIPAYSDAKLPTEWNFQNLEKGKAFMNAELTGNPLDSRTGQRDRLGVTPDKFSGMTIQQADELLGLQREMLEYLRGSGKTVAERTAPRS